MEVFHYVAEKLAGVPLFSSKVQSNLQTGAIFNDYDNANPFAER